VRARAGALSRLTIVWDSPPGGGRLDGRGARAATASGRSYKWRATVATWRPARSALADERFFSRGKLGTRIVVRE
jgi:hypothetical protein